MVKNVLLTESLGPAVWLILFGDFPKENGGVFVLFFFFIFHWKIKGGLKRSSFEMFWEEKSIILKTLFIQIIQRWVLRILSGIYFLNNRGLQGVV